VALRAVAIATLAFIVAWLLTAATDEGGVAWSERAARALPLAPACAALGTALALGRGRARGEALALEALGRAPWQRTAAAALGGAATALVAAALLGTSPTGARAFYPALRRGAAWRFDAEHSAFVDTVQGLVVQSDGTLDVQSSAEEGAPSLPRGGRAAAAVATASAGIAFALIAARLSSKKPARPVSGGGVGGSVVAPPIVTRSSRLATTLAVGTMVVSSIVLFQAAAASLVPAVIAPLPAIVLLAWAAWRYVHDADAIRR